MKTVVVNLRHEPFDVYIGRAKGDGGIFGNPFVIGKDGDREEVLRRFKAYFLERVERDPGFREKVLALRGKRLGCFCAPLACHGRIIADYVDG